MQKLTMDIKKLGTKTAEKFDTSFIVDEFYIDTQDAQESWVQPKLLQRLGFKTKGDGFDFKSLLAPNDRASLEDLMTHWPGGIHASKQLKVQLNARNNQASMALLQLKAIAIAEGGAVTLLRGIVLLLDADLLLATPSDDHARLLNAIPDMLFTFDERLNFIACKPGLEFDPLTAEAEQYHGLHISEAWPEFLVSKFTKVAHAFADEGNHIPDSFEFIIDWDGERNYYSCSISKYDNGKLAAIIRNITDRKRKDELLREVFDRRRIFIEQAPNAIAMLDRDFRYLAVSNQWVEDYGFQNREIIGEYHFDFFDNVGEEWKAILSEALRGTVKKGDKAPYERADGRKMLLKWEMRPWFVSAGEIGGIIIFTEDVTERCRIEAENEQLSVLQQLLVKVSTDFINLKATAVDEGINNALAEIAKYVSADRINVFHYNWEKGTARNTHEWCAEGIEPQIDILQDVPMDFSRRWVELHKRGEKVDIPDVSLTEDDELRSFFETLEIKGVLCIPLMAEGACIGFVGFDSVHTVAHFPEKEKELLAVFADMLVSLLSRVNALEQLQHTKARLEDILLQMNDVIWSIAVPEMSTAFISPSVEKLVGKSAVECAKTPFWWEEFIHPHDKHITEGMMLSLKEKGVYKAEHRIITTAGDMKWVKTRAHVIHNDLGRAIRIDAVIYDITKQKNNELQVRKLLQAANEQNERFRNFAHIVTHNMRSHSSNIGMLLNLWREENDNDTRALFTENLIQASARLGETIDDLTEVVEMSTTMDDALRPIALRHVVSHNLERLKAQIIQFKAKVDINIDEHVYVSAIPAYLESVVHNLLSNAIKYRSPDRKPHIEIAAKKRGDQYLIQVTDNGLGIDMERNGAKLFGFHKTFHNNEDARGLGLFITKNQVVSMGGSIEASSKVGVGSIFRVYLHAADRERSRSND